MDIYEFAKQFEMDGRAYYLELAEKSGGYVRRLFTMLADDELRHHEIVSRLQEQDAGYEPSDSFKEIHGLFHRLLSSGASFSVETTDLEAYAHAVGLEKESFDFYREQAEKSDNPKEQEILRRIANEEKKHQITLENLMELVRKPEEWVESAEFSHLPEYDFFTGRDVY